MRIKQHALAVGINNPNQLAKALGCHIDTATQLWKETTIRIVVTDLPKLRQALGVSLDAIFPKTKTKGDPK